MADQTALVRELYSRLPSLPPDKAAIVSELANRMGIAGSNPGEQMKQNAIANTNFIMQGDDEGPKQSFMDSFKAQLQGLNPVEIAKAYVNHMNHPYETASGLPGGGFEDIPGSTQAAKATSQTMNGNIGGAAGTVTGAGTNAAIMGGMVKGVSAAANAPVVAPTASESGASAAASAVKAIATNPAVQKAAIKGVLGYRAGKVWDLAMAAKKAIEADAASAAPVKASTDVSSKVEISPKVSVDSASNALGTKPTVDNVASSGKGYRTADTLDAPTQTALAKAAQSGKLNSLPADQKTTLVNAVKAGDNETVNKIVAQTAQGTVVDTNVANKVAILVKFAKDHNIDLEAISPEQRQTVADGAVAYAKMNGHGVLPKSGAYRGISDSTLQYVKDALAKMK
jgi:hypothetical protein